MPNPKQTNSTPITNSNNTEIHKPRLESLPVWESRSANPYLCTKLKKNARQLKFNLVKLHKIKQTKTAKRENIDENIDMEVNEPEIDTTTQNTSSAKESGQRKRGWQKN